MRACVPALTHGRAWQSQFINRVHVQVVPLVLSDAPEMTIARCCDPHCERGRQNEAWIQASTEIPAKQACACYAPRCFLCARCVLAVMMFTRSSVILDKSGEFCHHAQYVMALLQSGRLPPDGSDMVTRTDSSGNTARGRVLRHDNGDLSVSAPPDAAPVYQRSMPGGRYKCQYVQASGVQCARGVSP